MPKIILASGSPRRIGFLKQMGLKFTIEPSNIDEFKFYDPEMPPEEIAMTIALVKAQSVS